MHRIICKLRKQYYLFIPVHEVHETIIVIVVMGTFRRISRKLQVVWPKAVPLGIRVREDPSLEELII